MEKPLSTERLLLDAAGGYDTSLGDTRHYEASGWNYRLAGGYRITRRLNAVLAYAYDHSAIPQPLVSSIYWYDEPFDPYPPYAVQVPSSIGAVHLWSVTAEPRFQYLRTERIHGYVLAGGGFFRKMTSFTGVPGYPCQNGASLYCNFSRDTTQRFSNNAGGEQIGAGFERTISEFNRHTVFVEARYVRVNNRSSPQNTVYPPANYRTEYVPIEAGVRW